MSPVENGAEVYYLDPKDPTGPKLPPFNPITWSTALTIIGIIIYTILGTYMPAFMASAH